MAITKEFTGLLPPQSKRPLSSFFGPAGLKSILRDNFTISTWLAFGAVAQGMLILLFGRPALIPVVLLLLYRALDTYAMTVGWKHNKYMDGVIPKKFSAQFPDEVGNYGNKPADQEVVVFLIGLRNNHPLGVMAPGYAKIAKYFPDMATALENHAEEYGFLGMTTWLNSSTRDSGSEILSVGYFRSVEGLQKFAHSEHHRDGWDWFNRMAKQYPHYGIYHETYHVPKGNYETIYANHHLSGLASTTFKYTDALTGGDMWASPVVDASKGVLKTSNGRMSRSKGDEHGDYYQAF